MMMGMPGVAKTSQLSGAFSASVDAIFFTSRNAPASARSRRQGRAGLLGYHVCGVPGGPIRVGRAGALLVLAMRGLRATQCARQVGDGRVRRLAGLGASRQPECDLLEKPTVAVRVGEGGVGLIAGVMRSGSRGATARGAVPELRARSPGVKHLAHIDTARDELVVCRLDVRDD